MSAGFLAPRSLLRRRGAADKTRSTDRDKRASRAQAEGHGRGAGREADRQGHRQTVVEGRPTFSGENIKELFKKNFGVRTRGRSREGDQRR